MKTPRMNITQADLDAMLIQTNKLIMTVLKSERGYQLIELNTGDTKIFEVKFSVKNQHSVISFVDKKQAEQYYKDRIEAA